MTRAAPNPFHHEERGFRATAIAALVVAVGLAASCAGDTLSPVQRGEADATFALTAVNGGAVPAQQTLLDGRSVEVIADTIRTYETRWWTRAQRLRIIARDGTVDARSYRSEGTLRLEGRFLVLDFECKDTVSRDGGASADCVAPERALVTHERLVIDSSTYLYGFTLVYRKIDPS